LKTISLFLILISLHSPIWTQDVLLTIGDAHHGLNRLEINMVSTQTIYGFQFGLEGLNLLYGEYAFDNQGVFISIDLDNNLIMGFGFEYFILPGSGTLCNIYLGEGEDAAVCLRDPLFIGLGGVPLDTQLGDCTFV